MRISGTMLKEKWQENGDIVHENDVPDVYFTSIRVLDGQSTVLDDYVLYIQGEQVQGTAFRDNERAGIFCLKKPDLDSLSQSLTNHLLLPVLTQLHPLLK